MMINPEEQRLRDAVVEAALDIAELVNSAPTLWSQEKYSAAIDREGIAVKSLRDHRAKAAPEPTLRCEAPECVAARSYHWVQHSINRTFMPVQWNDGWRAPGAEEWQTPEQFARWGWLYHSPARPDARVEATDEALTEFADREAVKWPTEDNCSLDEAKIRYLKKALAHFNAPTPQPPDPPTRQAVAEWYRSRTVYDSPEDLIMKALVHFSATPKL